MLDSETFPTTQAATNLPNDTDGHAKPDTLEVPPPIDRTKFAWRKILPIHPDCAMIPEMSDDELRTTSADIKANDLRFPIAIIAANGSTELLDGRSRLDACELAGILRVEGSRIVRGEGSTVSGRKTVTLQYLKPGGLWDRIPVVHVPPGTDTRAFVLSANIHRRHLRAEEKRELIAKVIKAKPELSDSAIAKQVKVTTDKTVASVRRELEATSEIPKLEKTTGADGKARPAKKVSTKPKKQHDAVKAADDAPDANGHDASTPESSPPINAVNAMITTEVAPVTEPVVNPVTEPDNPAVAVMGAINVLIGAAKNVVTWADFLPGDLVYPKHDLDLVVERLTQLNKDMANRRGRGRPRKIDSTEVTIAP